MFLPLTIEVELTSELVGIGVMGAGFTWSRCRRGVRDDTELILAVPEHRRSSGWIDGAVMIVGDKDWCLICGYALGT